MDFFFLRWICDGSKENSTAGIFLMGSGIKLAPLRVQFVAIFICTARKDKF